MPTNILTASPTDPLLTPDDLAGIDETTRDTNERIRVLEPTIDNAAADVEALKLQLAGSRICRVTVNLNPAYSRGR